MIASIFSLSQAAVRQVLATPCPGIVSGAAGAPSVPTEPARSPGAAANAGQVAAIQAKVPDPAPIPRRGRRGVSGDDLALIEAAVQAGRVTRVAPAGHAGWAPSWWTL